MTEKKHNTQADPAKTRTEGTQEKGERAEGKKEEYKPQVPHAGHHGHLDREEAEGAKEEYRPERPKPKGH